jgi:hypothetical protein
MSEDWRAETLSRIRSLIEQAAPDVVEEVVEKTIELEPVHLEEWASARDSFFDAYGNL